MKFRVGQKVRSLHDKGEGVVVSLIDASYVEVDFGDDFPFDIHIQDLIPVDTAEEQYLGGSSEGTITQDGPLDPESRLPLTLGTSMLDVSLIFSEAENDRFQVSVANPEPSQILYTVYRREKKHYHGLASGMLNSGAVKDVAILSGAELARTHSFYTQVINFIPGKGHPHTPLIAELAWKKDQLKMPPKFLEAVGGPAWHFSLRKTTEETLYETLSESDVIRVAREDSPRPEIHMEIDLHLEELIDDPDKVSPADALHLQMEAVARALSDALVNHASSLVLIHGVGAGKLRQEVHGLLKRTRHVKSFEQAERRQYGEGATKVIFQ